MYIHKGIQIAVYTKKHLKRDIQNLQILDVACGVGNVLTNKGAICVLLRLRDKTVALVNAHLAAHVGKVCIF
jgi:2-polyprenyl-3-methyl-5-hydroxy-6-metoxy-1,4-benzoquinol methylase